MNRYKLVMLFAIVIGASIPIANAQNTGAWIEDLEISSEVTPGFNVSVTLEIGYNMDGEATLNPGIFSYAEDDWITDLFITVSGEGSTTTMLEFPTPDEEELQYYQANVWYIINDEWFFDHGNAAWNFTLGQNTSAVNDYIHIKSIVAHHEIPTDVTLEIGLDYQLFDETEFGIIVKEGENIVVDELETLNGTGEQDMSIYLGDVDRDIPHTLKVEITGITESNSTISSSINITLDPIESPEPDPEPTEPETQDDTSEPPSTQPGSTATDEPETPQNNTGNPQIPGYQWYMTGIGLIVAVWLRKD